MNESHNNSFNNYNDDWRPLPYAQRASQHIKFGDFIKRGIGHLLIGGFSGSMIGWGIDHVRVASTNNFNKGLTSFKAIGGLVGTLIGGWAGWRRNEAMRLQTDQVLQDYRDLPSLFVDNAELTKDNKMLERIVEHQKKKLSEQPTHYVRNGNELGTITDQHSQYKAH